MNDFIKFKVGVSWKLNIREYQGLYRDIFEILDNAVIEENDISEAIQNAKKHLEILDKIAKTKYAHKNTAIIKGLFQERTVMIRSLLSGMASGAGSYSAEKRKAAEVLHLWSRIHRSDMRSQNRYAQTGAVYSLFSEWLSDTKVSDALELLSLDDQFEEIVAVSDRMNALTAERNKAISELKKRNRRKRMQSYRALYTVLTYLAGQANSEGPRQDFYLALCATIENSIGRATATMLARRTAAQNRKNQDSGNGEGTEGSENNEPDVDNTTGSASSSEGDGPEDDESNDDNSDIEDNTDVQA